MYGVFWSSACCMACKLQTCIILVPHVEQSAISTLQPSRHWQPYAEGLGCTSFPTCLCASWIPVSCIAVLQSLHDGLLHATSVSQPPQEVFPASQGHNKKCLCGLETAPCRPAQSQHPALQHGMQARPQRSTMQRWRTPASCPKPPLETLNQSCQALQPSSSHSPWHASLQPRLPARL